MSPSDDLLLAAIKADGGAVWVEAFENRYLGFEKIESARRVI